MGGTGEWCGPGTGETIWYTEYPPDPRLGGPGCCGGGGGTECILTISPRCSDCLLMATLCAELGATDTIGGGGPCGGAPCGGGGGPCGDP